MNDFQKLKTPPVGLVTIDVEPDNVWANTYSHSYANILSLMRFHRLCQDFGVRPTYLVSWSVVSDDACATILENLLSYGDCEIGVHPHLWEIPPFVELDKSGHATVGLQYPEEILEDKLFNLVRIIKERFGAPLSHRAGRWGMDTLQIKILSRLGIKVDSSVIPGIDWSSTGILDFTGALLSPYFPSKEDFLLAGNSDLLEVPCTIKPGFHLGGMERNRYLASVLKRAGLDAKWLRATPSTSVNGLVDVCSWATGRLPQLNMMTHSSELSAGDSPYWKTSSDIQRHLDIYRSVFSWWIKNRVQPMTLSEFRDHYVSEQKKGVK